MEKLTAQKHQVAQPEVVRASDVVHRHVERNVNLLVLDVLVVVVALVVQDVLVNVMVLVEVTLPFTICVLLCVERLGPIKTSNP